MPNLVITTVIVLLGMRPSTLNGRAAFSAATEADQIAECLSYGDCDSAPITLGQPFIYRLPASP